MSAFQVSAVGFALFAAFATSGCGQTPSRPAKSPADQAAFMERTRCSPDDSEGALAPVLNGAALESVRPLYGFTTSGKTGTGSDLRGVIFSRAEAFAKAKNATALKAGEARR
jgi:hypothetical protein